MRIFVGVLGEGRQIGQRYAYVYHFEHKHNVYYLFIGIVCCESYETKVEDLGMNSYCNIY